MKGVSQMSGMLSSHSDNHTDEKSNDIPAEKEKKDLSETSKSIIFYNTLDPNNSFDIYTFRTEHNGRIGKHSHDFYEIIYITDGFTLHSLNGTMNILVTGDLLFIKPGETHSYINAYQTKLYNLLFMTDALGSFRSELSSLPGLSEMFDESEADTDFPSDDRRTGHMPPTARNRSTAGYARELYTYRSTNGVRLRAPLISCTRSRRTQAPAGNAL